METKRTITPRIKRKHGIEELLPLANRCQLIRIAILIWGIIK